MSNLPIPPSSNIDSSLLYPPIKNQHGIYCTCVAEALTTILELFHSRTMDLDSDSTSMYEYYSNRYLFGSDNNSYGPYGMEFTAALETVRIFGVPRWELVDNYYPQRGNTEAYSPYFTVNKEDSDYPNWVAEAKADAMAAYRRSSTNELIQSNAAKQKIDTWSYIDFYNLDDNREHDIVECLNAGGYVALGITIPENWNDTSIGPDGIVPQPGNPAETDDPNYTTAGHMVVIIGLTTINNVKYWIAVNSWGENWGNDGVCYIPYDWGYGRPAYVDPDGEYRIDWVRGCFAVYPKNNIDVNHPNPPTITNAKFVENDPETGKPRAEISFAVQEGCSVFIYATDSDIVAQDLFPPETLDLNDHPYPPDPSYPDDEIVSVWWNWRESEPTRYIDDYGNMYNKRHEFLWKIQYKWWPKGPNGGLADFGYCYSTSPVIITLDDPNKIYRVSLIAINNNTKAMSLRSAAIKIENGSNIFIYHNGGWVPATPYIYHNGRWVQAQAKIFQNGWK